VSNHEPSTVTWFDPPEPKKGIPRKRRKRKEYEPVITLLKKRVKDGTR